MRTIMICCKGLKELCRAVNESAPAGLTGIVFRAFTVRFRADSLSEERGSVGRRDTGTPAPVALAGVHGVG